MEEQYKMSVETRILFTDLDGTLLNDHKEVTSETRRQLMKLWHVDIRS